MTVNKDLENVDASDQGDSNEGSKERMQTFKLGGNHLKYHMIRKILEKKNMSSIERLSMKQKDLKQRENYDKRESLDIRESTPTKMA